MESFLSTLISTTATMIALLLGSVAAYFVFLQGKVVEYDDKIEIERRAIRVEIGNMQAIWPTALAFYLTPEFRERFSARLGNVRGAQFVEKFTGCSTFPPSPELEGALSDVKKQDTFGPANWRGRVFAVAIDEAIKTVSENAQVGLVSPEPANAAFPRSASESGFAEWRRDFDGVSGTMRFLELESPAAVEDFRQFLQTHPRLRWSPDELYVKPLHTVFASFSLIRTHLRSIDELSLSRSRYLFDNRVHRKSLLVLISASVIVGILLPMLILASFTTRISTIASVSVLMASTALLGGAFIQFGYDIFRPLTPDPGLYLADRWLRPLVDELDKAKLQLDNLGPLESERITQTLDSGPVNKLSGELAYKLRSYRESLIQYNSCVEQLDTIILSKLEDSSDLAPFRKQYLDIPSVSHPNLYTLDLASADRFSQIEHGLGDREIVLDVVSRFSWGSRGRMGLLAPPRKHDALISVLERIHQSLIEGDDVKKCLQIRSETAQRLAAAKADLQGFIAKGN
jgi:hypothetical protein